MEIAENAIVENIVKIRTSLRFTKRMMAEKMGLSEGSYGRIEIGQIALSYAHLSKIASIFDMPVIDLITYPERYVRVGGNLDPVSDGIKDERIRHLEEMLNEKERLIQVLLKK